MRKIRKTVLAGFALAATILSLAGCTRNENAMDQYNANAVDITFANAAAVSNYTEITLGKLDTLKALDSAGKAFGDMMITDHTASNTLLKSIANPIGLSTPDTLDTDHQALRTQLMGLTGRAFDSVYIKNMVTDHEAAIALFTNEASKGQYFQLKLYATNALPILQQHLDMATAISAKY